MTKEEAIREINTKFLNCVRQDKSEYFMSLWSSKAYSLRAAMEAILNYGGAVDDTYSLFGIILDGTADFLSGFPAPPVYKQKIYELLRDCICEINKKYKINYSDDDIDDALPPPIKTDTDIALIKALHPDNETGKSREALKEELGISTEAVKRGLLKLDPSLRRMGKKEPPFRLGGQALEVKIKADSKSDSGSAKTYSTPDSLHPIVLQMNVMQVGSLLRALAYAYHNEITRITLQTATDIWMQLSPYGKNRIKTVFAYRDKTLSDFIGRLEEIENGDRLPIFMTEKDMTTDEEHSTLRDRLELAFKTGLNCDIQYRINGNTVVESNRRIIRDLSGDRDSFYIVPFDLPKDKEFKQQEIKVKEKDILEILPW